MYITYSVGGGGGGGRPSSCNIIKSPTLKCTLNNEYTILQWHTADYRIVVLHLSYLCRDSQEHPHHRKCIIARHMHKSKSTWCVKS